MRSLWEATEKMSWFSEQINDRKKQDKTVFYDSFIKLTAAVVGKGEALSKLGRRPSQYSVADEILDYFGFKRVEIPSKIKDIEKRLEYAARPYGIMIKRVTLEGEWYLEAFQPMVVKKKDGDDYIAVLPKGHGFVFFDEKKSRYVKVKKRNSRIFGERALAFYEPFPLHKLSVTDLLTFMYKKITPNDIFMLAMGSFGAVLVGMISTHLTRTLFREVIQSENMQALTAMAFFMICVLISSKFVHIIHEMITEAINSRISLSVEAASYMRLMSISVPFFRDYSSGELANRIGYIKAFCTLIVKSVLSVGFSSLFSLLYIGQVNHYAPSLLETAIITVIITFLLTVFAIFLQTRISRKRMEYTAKESGLFLSLVGGIQKIKLAGAEKRAFAKWADVYSTEAGYAYDLPIFLKVYPIINMGINLACTLVVYFLAVHTEVEYPDYVAFTAAFGMMQGAFTALSSVAVSVADIKPIFEMCKPILDAPIEADPSRAPLEHLNGGIELSHVSFSYDKNSDPIFTDLSLKIRPGEYLAIVGETGCGKSTLIRLLLGFEEPTKGAVLYGGIDLKRIDLETLRRKIGAVMQNDKLFHGTIYANIAIACDDPTPEKIWEAARLAQIAEDIENMPMGMNTMISEGSGGVSGGQRQRILIARAIACKPKILIFDEATSALDNITQKKISNALDQIKCTRIVIAHRLSTIKNCGRILVLSAGKVVESGSYDSLMEKDGYFAGLVHRQQLRNNSIDSKKGE